MKVEHEAYWAALRDRFIKDVELLLQHNSDESAMTLMVAFVDSVASLFAGRASERGVETSFRLFITRYLPTFARVQVGDLMFDERSNRRVNDCVDMLYFCFRNGLIHEGVLPFGIRLLRLERSCLFLFNATGTMTLSAPQMYLSVRAAIAQYEIDLQTDTELQSKFAERMQYLARNRFKKQPRAIEDGFNKQEH